MHHTHTSIIHIAFQSPSASIVMFQSDSTGPGIPHAIVLEPSRAKSERLISGHSVYLPTFAFLGPAFVTFHLGSASGLEVGAGIFCGGRDCAGEHGS